MSQADLRPTLDTLRSLYRHTETLEEFADRVVFREGRRAALVEQSDSRRFKSFVRGVFVCSDRELRQVPSCSQICTLPELLAFVVNSLKRKRKKNILVHGYSFLSVAREERDADHFRFQGDVTQSAAYIHGSDLWRKVVTRLGTDLTRYLLESCSAFVAVPPSCLFQVCGAPVYDRVSATTASASAGFHLQPRSGRRRRRRSVRLGRTQGAATSKRRREVGSAAVGGTRNGRDARAKTGKRKRKRDADQKDEEETTTCLGKRRREVGGTRNGRNGRNGRGKTRKRKRDADQKDEEETTTCLGKRRREGRQEPPVEEEQLEPTPSTKEGQPEPTTSTKEEQPEPTTSTKEGQPEPTISMEEEQPEPTPSTKPSENRPAGSEQPVEKMQTTATPCMEGGPSWRSGIYPPPPPSQSFVRTLGFLYGGRGMRGFLLNRRRKKSAAAAAGCRRLDGRDLVRMVFFEGLALLSHGPEEAKPKKLPRRFLRAAAPLFARLMRRHRSCAYGRMLQRTCPEGEEGLSDAQPGELGDLLPRHHAAHRVYLFVRACLSAVVPRELWGSERNRLQFLFGVRRFLSGGKFERLSVAELMWKMRVNDCDWLKISKTGRVPPSELSYRTQILGQLLAWLLDGYVAGLVRACFYATESVGQKNAVRFYRQEVWAKLQDLAFRGHLSKGQMEELTPAQVAALPKATVVSRLRFIPKTDSMRPITRVVGAGAKTWGYRGRVRDLQDILRACVRSTPALLGSTVWGMTDIHKVLRSIAPAQKDKPQPLYFVKVDVSGAYESLPHDKLIEVIGQALAPVQEELFTIRRYAKIWADSHEGLKKSFVRQADFLEGNMGSTNMKGFVTSLQKKGRVHHAILVEQHFSSDLHGREALQFFTQMLTGSVVQFGKKTYRQCRGIPQGSVVSSLLCCLCYGHMENVLFKDITENKGCLMRLVDDFLLITPNLHNAQTFLKTLLAGVPQYGLVVNPQKVAVNFEVAGGGGAASCPGVRELPPHCLFPWCGLLLDTQSLDVSKDYSSYAGLSLRYSLTLGSLRSAGQQMRRKLMAVLRLKCHPLFLDLKTNSFEAVYKNIYKLVLLHACRFHVCAQSFPFGQTVAKNPVYFLQMIFNMAEYANQLIRLSNKGRVLGSKTQGGVVQYEAVELLFCLAFLLVMSRHRPLYRDLIPHLHRRKRSLERRLGAVRLARVRQAAAPRTPGDFLAIQM